jgi:small subunit ribosomal protein S1
VGDRIEGRVVSITDYGAFIELEKGVEGLIHISEMSWTKHVKHPSKILSVGQTIEAVVLKVDKDNQKISLGLKQTEPDPWTTIEQNYPIGTRLSGTVRNLTNFGAFVELEEGIDGLLHISDMSWAKRVRHPSEVVKKGDVIEVMVLDISQEKKRISLGMKQLTENPWDMLADEYAVDTDTEGKITRTLDRGAVVELRSDVEGFVPVGQMGFEDIRHPDERYAVGDVLPLRVIKVDPKNKRIVLSVTAFLRKLSEDEVQEFMDKYPKKELKPAEESAEEGAQTGEEAGASEAKAAPTEASSSDEDASPEEDASKSSEEPAAEASSGDTAEPDSQAESPEPVEGEAAPAAEVTEEKKSEAAPAAEVTEEKKSEAAPAAEPAESEPEESEAEPKEKNG